MKTTPVWHEGLEFPAGETGPLPERVDLAVVGAGYTGLAAAREAARRGATVAVLEAHSVGWGASSRNGGMVLTGLKLGLPDLAARYGAERARRLFDASLAAIGAVEQIVAEEQIDCAFARGGHLVVASRPAHMRALAEEAALLQRLCGHPTALLGPDELRDELDAHGGYHGGLLDPASAGIQPARYVAGLALAARRAGARIYTHTPVERLDRAGAGWSLRTPRGALRADEVLVASGGYTGAATPQLRRRLVPLGSYIIATAPLPEALAHSLIPRGRMVFDTLHLLHYYRLTPDRRLLFGGRASFVPATAATVPRSAAILERELHALFPQLRGVPVEHAWGGLLDVPLDMMPHTGRAGGLHYALGYAGHGVAMGTLLGARLGARLAGDSSPDVWDGLPFPALPAPLAPAVPLGLPLAGLWYRWLDARE